MKINGCRISGSSNLEKVLSLGNQCLTGIFPSSPSIHVPTAPLDLVWCPDSRLLQLHHTFPLDQMYGASYGYRSGLNASMVEHLTSKVLGLQKLVDLAPGDCVIDIGSNDCTLLKSYTFPNLSRIGIDPTAEKYSSFYPSDVSYLPEFFPSPNIDHLIDGKKVKIITSIAMFYDLPDPVEFARQIALRLDKSGIWHLEQSYMPSMLRLNSYDTICHEHLEYYSLENIIDILSKAGLVVFDVQMNAINGGSFAITAAHRDSAFSPNKPVIEWLLSQERILLGESPKVFVDFALRVETHRTSLKRLVDNLTSDGKRVFGYGASTKGNVVLQFCGFGPSQIPMIADVNPDKYGCIAPGTNIPIVSEQDARRVDPDYFLLLPWHFKDSVLRRERDFLNAGGEVYCSFSRNRNYRLLM